jgi:hypothetical protein
MNKKRIIGKNGWAKEERHKGSLTQRINKTFAPRSREEALSDISAIQLVSIGLHVKESDGDGDAELSR